MTLKLVFGPALVLACAACSGGPRTLDVHGLALNAPAPMPVAETAASAVKPSGEAPLDHRTEERLSRELADKLAKGGAAALELIEPGASVESRLRFALSRRFLRRDKEAEQALTSLVKAAPDCALAHVLLAQSRLESGDSVQAVESFRRAQALQKEQNLPVHPALGFGLACALLDTDDADEGMRLMREELAGGTYRRRAAELLAQMNAEAGEFEEALAALDAVLDAEPKEPALVLAKAEVLGDQLRYDEALQLLERHGDRIQPTLRIHRRALLLRRAGRAQQALQLFDELLERHAEDASVKASVAELQATRAEIAAERSRGVMRRTARDLLGHLRYAPQPAQRIQAVRALCEVGRPRTVHHSVRWALRDPDESVRAVGVQVGALRCENALELVATALQDRAPIVRSSAGAVAVELGKSPRAGAAVVAPMVVAALEREVDPSAFKTLHKVLAAIVDGDVSLPFDAERSAEGRSGVAAAWRAAIETQAKQRTKS